MYVREPDAIQWIRSKATSDQPDFETSLYYTYAWSKISNIVIYDVGNNKASSSCYALVYYGEGSVEICENWSAALWNSIRLILHLQTHSSWLSDTAVWYNHAQVHKPQIVIDGTSHLSILITLLPQYLWHRSFDGDLILNTTCTHLKLTVIR